MNESTKKLLQSKYVLALGICALLLIGLIVIAFISSSQNSNSNTNGVTPTNTNAFNVNKSSSSAIDAYFSESSIKIQKNSEYEVGITVKNTTDTVIQGYESYLTFNKTNVAITNITVVTGAASTSISDSNDTLSTVNGKGEIKLLSEIQSASGLTLKANSETVLVKVKFKILNAVASKISFSITQASNLYVVNTSNLITKSMFTPTNSVDLTI